VDENGCLRNSTIQLNCPDASQGEEMSKEKRSAEQQVADEADRRALHPLATRQTIADSQAAPEFQQNHKRLRADRLAREAELTAKGK
jgi:hypothetical protein